MVSRDSLKMFRFMENLSDGATRSRKIMNRMEDRYETSGTEGQEGLGQKVNVVEDFLPNLP